MQQLTIFSLEFLTYLELRLYSFLLAHALCVNFFFFKSDCNTAALLYEKLKKLVVLWIFSSHSQEFGLVLNSYSSLLYTL